MIVSDTAVKNRISVVILAIIILTVGTYCYNALPREDEPDITIPYVFVSTQYKGVASEDIETSITIQIEKKLKGLSGVKKVSSTSAEGQSDITIEFVPGTDIDDALQKVKDKVDEAKGDLPGDLENDPVVFEVNFSELPIVVYSLSGPSGTARLKQIADDLEEDIESINGVLEVNVTGGLEREIIIEVDTDKLAYYNIPITAFYSVVTGENTNTSGGAITLGDGRYQLRVPGEFEKPEEIYGLVIASFNGNPVYLKDLARVTDGFEEESSRARLNGRSAVNISVKKRSGENIIAISEEIDKLISESKSSWPQGTEITKLMDKAKGIRTMIADLENNILSGLLLVVIVLLFALGFRNAVLVALAIPFSMLLTFSILYALGITLNVVVLFSLTLALGMLVDNAIVIVENIYRYLEQGVSRIEAAKKASSEVAYPVIGSTMTTLAAFFPMLFWPGIMGDFMSYLPLTLIITLTSSLFVALVINPALAAIFIKIKGQKKPDLDSPQSVSVEELSASGEKPVMIEGFILKLYSRIINTALNHRVTVIICSFLMLIVFFQIWQLAVGIEKPVEFFPKVDPDSVYVNVDPPEGADIDYIDRIVKKVEMAVNGVFRDDKDNTTKPKLKDYNQSYTLKQHEKLSGEKFNGPSDLKDIEYIYAASVENATASSFEQNSPTHLGLEFIDFEERIKPTAVSVEKIRQRVRFIPGATITVSEEQGGPPTGDPVNIEISGDDFKVLGKLAKEIQNIISRIPFIEDVRDDYMAGLPSIQVKLDRQKVALFGLTTDQVGFILKTAYNGLDISTYREHGEDYDITVKLNESDRRVTDVLHKLMIPTPSGQVVPLTTLGNISYSGTIGSINRINHSRVVTVKANVDETKMPGPVLRAEAEKLLENFKSKLPAGYNVTFTGQNEEQQKSQDFLSKAFLVAIFLIFLILVTLFNSVSQPIIILTSVILSLGGVFLGLAFMKYPFGIIMSGVGVISLAGVVVNNAIVLIDYTNMLRENGMQLRDAIVAAGATRLRPVLLTAITTVLGLIPMVTGVSFNFRKFEISWVSETAQFWASMAIVVIFGLIVATFLTLIVVPTLYSLLATLPDNVKSITGKIKDYYWGLFETIYEKYEAR